MIGDLSTEKFGLSDEQWQELAQTIEVIYHNGALLNFIFPYEFLCREITDHRMQKAAIFFFPAFVVFHIFNQSFQTGFFRICTYQTVQMQSLLWILGQDCTDQLRTQKSGGTCQQNISAVLWSCFIGS